MHQGRRSPGGPFLLSSIATGSFVASDALRLQTAGGSQTISACCPAR